MFVLVQCNTSLSRSYSLCDRLNLRRNRFVCALWLSAHMKSFLEQRFFHEFVFDNKVLKTFVKFRIC